MKKADRPYQFPLNFYRELCLYMDKNLPDFMTEDEEKGIRCIVDIIKYDEDFSILVERFQYDRDFKNIAKDRGISPVKASALVKKRLAKLTEKYYIGLIFGYEKYITETSVNDINLSNRAMLGLIRNNINTLDDIRKAGRKKLRSFRFVGEEVYNEILFKTWFLWDSERQVKLSARHKENITSLLTEKGWKVKEIREFIEGVEDN